jgi:peptidase E
MNETRAPIFLLAGGRATRMRKGPDPLLQEVFFRTGFRLPTVAYVGAASGDNAEFRLWMTGLLQEAGAGEVKLAPLCGKRKETAKARSVLERADLIFIGGGDVEEGKRVLDEKEMTPFLRDLHQAGKPFFGMSAGSIILAQKWVRWRDPEDNESVEVFPCLGLASLLCDTHGEDDRWEELKVLLALSPDGSIGYGIGSGTAIAVGPDGALSALGGEVDRFRKQGAGIVRIQSLVPNSNPR